MFCHVSLLLVVAQGTIDRPLLSPGGSLGHLWIPWGSVVWVYCGL